MKKNNLFKIYHITNGIYLFLFDNAFDLSMHFCRYQEYYESPKFKNTQFTILQFIEWYSKTYGDGIFTYTRDWGGFNIPGDIIWKVQANIIADYNKYDAAMIKAFNQISSITHIVNPSAVQHDSFYILGACKTDLGVLKHELAHGLFYTDTTYRDAMQKLHNELPKTVVSATYKYFSTIGYTKEVFVDELQAYFATGLTPQLQQFKLHTKSFVRLFNSYKSKIDFDIKNHKPIGLVQ